MIFGPGTPLPWAGGPQGRAVPADAPAPARELRGQRASLGGRSAEELVSRHYTRRGYAELDRRWRGQGGEIDLILSGEAGIVFVEVKSSATHALAAIRLLPAQIRRLHLAAEEYLGAHGGGGLTPCRFDLATVDGIGSVEIIGNIGLN